MSLIKNNRGMTLVEVLVAIAIFAVAAIPLIGVFYNSTITNSISKIKTQEAIIAQDVVENIKAKNIVKNEDIQKLPIPSDYQVVIPVDPVDMGNGLMRYKIQVIKINSKAQPYTIYAVAPATDVTTYTPPVIPSNNGQGDGGNDGGTIGYILNWVTIAIIAIWTFLFVIFVVIPALGLFSTIIDVPILINSIVNSIKSGITDLKTIATNAANSIGLSIPWWLRWW